MAFFSSTRIGISIQDDLLVVSEIVSDGYEKNQQIRALNASKIPKGIFKEGHIADSDKLKKIVLETLEKAKPKPIKGSEITFEVPEQSTFYTILHLPKEIPQEQLMEAVMIEAEKILPFSIDQMSWDSKVISSDKDEKTLLFSASPQDFVQEYYDFFNKCGLQPLGFSTRLENLINVVNKGKAKPTVLLDMQQDSTNVIFFAGRTIVATQQISIGEKELKRVIQEHFDLDSQKIDEQLKKLSLVDVSLATVHLMKSFDQELTALVNDFQRKKNRQRRRQ